MRDVYGLRPVTVISTVAGANRLITQISCRLAGWSLQDQAGVPVAEALDTAVAAAAAGTLTLTGFITVSLVRVTPAAAWPAGVNQVTLTNVTGGTQTVDIEGGTASAAEFLLPVPLATTANPVVSVPAIAGGPAYTIEAEGTIAGGFPPASQSLAQIFDGSQLLATSRPPVGGVDNFRLSDQGLYVGTNLNITVQSGGVQGVLWIVDAGVAAGEAT